MISILNSDGMTHKTEKDLEFFHILTILNIQFSYNT